jgi:hypothetical protein
MSAMLFTCTFETPQTALSVRLRDPADGGGGTGGTAWRHGGRAAWRREGLGRRLFVEGAVEKGRENVEARPPVEHAQHRVQQRRAPLPRGLLRLPPV